MARAARIICCSRFLFLHRGAATGLIEDHCISMLVPSCISTAMKSKPVTTDESYTERLVTHSTVWWKRLIDVQMPYRWNLRRLNLGFTLDIGCGIGRNLLHLEGNGVGIDHNRTSVEIARTHGLVAFTPEEFDASEYNVPERFDSILLAHVVEHMTEPESQALLSRHAGLLKPGGTCVLIAPQERGFRSDSTHVQFMDFGALRRLASSVGFESVREYSFPFPRRAGRLFTYNEFVSLSRKGRA